MLSTICDTGYDRTVRPANKRERTVWLVNGESSPLRQVAYRPTLGCDPSALQQRAPSPVRIILISAQISVNTLKKGSVNGVVHVLIF